ncbi:MAG: hypothetical protein HN826_06930 [Methylococcales bacterium]|nr:hypothetical protein [Methylococcales bacterium]
MNKSVLIILSAFFCTLFIAPLSAKDFSFQLKANAAPPTPTRLTASVAFNDPSGNQMLDATETAYLQVVVKNQGPGDAHDIKIQTLALQGGKQVRLSRSILLGDLANGRQVIKKIPLKGKRQLANGKLKLQINTVEGNGFDADPVTISLSTRQFYPPNLQVVDLGIDDQNQNSQIEPLEVVQAVARVQNKGQGMAHNVVANIEMGKNVFAALQSQQTFAIGELKPGAFYDVKFSFYTNRRIGNGKRIPVKLILSESRVNQQRSESLKLTMNSPQRRASEVVVAGVTSPSAVTSGGALTALNVDVDINIPTGNRAGDYDIAVIVGNGSYQKNGVPNVDYAHRDIAILEQYLLKTMGFKKENILVEKDATKGVFETLFGTASSTQGKVYNYIKPNVSRLFVYYVGHGAPSPKSGQGFFVPVDADPDYIQTSGYQLSVFYDNLKKIPAKEKIVVIDACFSGRTQDGLLFKNVSPALLKVKQTNAGLSAGAVLSSSQGEQLSTWFPQKKHSLFTYFFLKGLQGEADSNNNKIITMGEMAEYVESKVPYQARRIAGKEQNPKIEGKRDIVLARLK